jgi:hypothetical protein
MAGEPIGLSCAYGYYLLLGSVSLRCTAKDVELVDSTCSQGGAGA